MKVLIAILILNFAALLVAGSVKSSSEDDDWAEDVILTIRECKKCTKQQVYDKLTKLTDEYMKDVKPGTLDRVEAERDVADVANMLTADDAITGAEFKEFIKNSESKYEDKFAKSTKKP